MSCRRARRHLLAARSSSSSSSSSATTTTLLLSLAPPPPRPLPAIRRSTHRPAASHSPPTSSTAATRHFSTARPSLTDHEDKWTRHRTQYNYDPFTLHPSSSHLAYPLVTASDLAKSSTRPRGVRMLARDFIHDSLYNPYYGYFSRQAVLLPEAQSALNNASSSSTSPPTKDKEQGRATATVMDRPERFDFSSMASESDFLRAVQKRYTDFEEKFDAVVDARQCEKQDETEAQESQQFAFAEREERRRHRRSTQPSSSSLSASPGKPVASYSAQGLKAAQSRSRMLLRKTKEGVQDSEVQTMAAKQVWHTPTQIFQPYYARAIARYLVAEYKLQLYPYDDLVVYELGAGSGALAHDVLDYLAEEEPEIYRRTRYKIVEISLRLAGEQKRRLKHYVENGTVEVVNRSFLEWNEDVPEPCFVVALEVLDNLAHDVIRYSTSTLEPYQALVSIDETGDMHELWEPLSDPLIKRYLSLLHTIYPSTVSLPLAASSTLLRFIPSSLAAHIPFYPNLTPPHYLPTGSLQMMDILRRHFPHHRLVISDFDSLPESCQGIDAPVVQTRYKGTMVPVSTYMVLQGFFDIFFPTDFPTLKQVYQRVMNLSHRGGGGGGSYDDGRRNLGGDYFSSMSFRSNMMTAGGTGGGTIGERNVRLYSHAEFLERYAETDKVMLKDGSNPMLSWYGNASWFLS